MDPARAIQLSAVAGLKDIDEAIYRGGSEIQEFYRNSTIFITGGSGFIGKQLVEKLLRACQPSTIFLLLRPKKGKSAAQRVADMIQEPVFDHLRSLQPNFSDTLVAIEGDVSELNLGISAEDWTTITVDVDVVLHLAATIRLSETLRDITLTNLRGTRECLKLARACTKLRSFVHVSTAYANATTDLIGKDVEEQFYLSPLPPETLISLAETMDEEYLHSLELTLTKPWPNNYSFAKALAEELVRCTSDGLPICIIRPSIVTASYVEPSPGWLDTSTIFGASGMFFGVSLGLIHTALTNSNIMISFIPCDYLNNAIIAAGKQAANSKGGDHTTIYHLSNVTRNPISWGDYMQLANTKLASLHTPKAFYYVYGIETSNKVVFSLLTLFLHLIPGYIVDFICLLIGQKPRVVKVYKKIYKLTSLLSYFLMCDWNFLDNNSENLFNSMSAVDKKIFNFDVTSLDWSLFVQVWGIGLRQFVVKDGLKDTIYAIKKQKILRILHYCLTVLYFYCIWKVYHFLFLTAYFVLF